MRATIRLCREHGVAIGAHPSFEDREHFGRRELALDRDEIARLVQSQLARLAAVAAQEGVRIAHVKPHGALYNLAARDRGIAEAIAAAVACLRCFADPVWLVRLATHRCRRIRGLRVAHEVFAERAYEADGSLAPRGTPGAVIDDLDTSLAQVRTLLREGMVIARDGSRVALRADTLCLHGDRIDAAGFARALREALDADGIRIAAPGRLA